LVQYSFVNSPASRDPGVWACGDVINVDIQYIRRPGNLKSTSWFSSTSIYTFHMSHALHVVVVVRVVIVDIGVIGVLWGVYRGFIGWSLRRGGRGASAQFACTLYRFTR